MNKDYEVVRISFSKKEKATIVSMHCDECTTCGNNEQLFQCICKNRYSKHWREDMTSFYTTIFLYNRPSTRFDEKRRMHPKLLGWVMLRRMRAVFAAHERHCLRHFDVTSIAESVLKSLSPNGTSLAPSSKINVAQFKPIKVSGKNILEKKIRSPNPDSRSQ